MVVLELLLRRRKNKHSFLLLILERSILYGTKKMIKSCEYIIRHFRCSKCNPKLKDIAYFDPYSTLCKCCFCGNIDEHMESIAVSYDFKIEDTSYPQESHLLFCSRRYSDEDIFEQKR